MFPWGKHFDVVQQRVYTHYVRTEMACYASPAINAEVQFILLCAVKKRKVDRHRGASKIVWLVQKLRLIVEYRTIL